MSDNATTTAKREFDAMEGRIADAVVSFYDGRDSPLPAGLVTEVQQAVNGQGAIPVLERIDRAYRDEFEAGSRGALALESALVALKLRAEDEPGEIDGAEAAQRVFTYAAMVTGYWFATRRWTRKTDAPDWAQKMFVRLMTALFSYRAAADNKLDKKGGSEVGMYVATKIESFFNRGES